MIRPITKIVTTGVLICFSVVAHSTVITETWEATVTTVFGHTVFSRGDTFQYTITYDNSSKRMTVHKDGDNNKAEFGAGDDLPHESYCMATYTGIAPCTTTLFGDHTLFADAIINISQFYDPMAIAGLTGRDIYSENQARRFAYYDNKPRYDYQRDDTQFGTHDAFTYHHTEINGRYFARTNYNSKLLSTTYKVTEPSSIAIIAVGVLGLGVLRRRRHHL